TVRIFSGCDLAEEIAMNDDSCGVQSEVTFISDGTSTYLIMVEGYDTNAGDYEIAISCEDGPEEPENCEDFVVLSNELQGAYFFEGSTSQHLATDIQMGDTAFTLYGIEPTLI